MNSEALNQTIKKSTKLIKLSVIPDETIIRKIHLIRGQKVMFDFDLAELYGVETKRLKEQVKRNIERFPAKYMFELSLEEAEVSRSQIATLKQGQNIKHRPFVFTEHGVLMLSNILKSKQAIQVSMRIIDMFVYLREAISTNDNLRSEIENIKKKIENHGKNIELVFQYLDELIEKKEKPRTKIGYKISKK